MFKIDAANANDFRQYPEFYDLGNFEDILAPAAEMGIMMPQHVTAFPLGKVVVTSGAWYALPTNILQEALSRHATCDWGDLGAADQKANWEAMGKPLRLFSKYIYNGEDADGVPDQISIYVITEWDRSVTTILLPEEY